VTVHCPAEVFWSEEDGAGSPSPPIFPVALRLVKAGPKPLRNLSLLSKAWIEAAKAAGNSIPQPSQRLRA